MPYCVVIVKNESANILRKRMKLVPLDDLWASEDAPYSEIEEMWEQNIDKAKLLSVFNRLSDKERYLLHLRYANNMSFKEIAALLDVSEEVAKKRGFRILKKLRAFYEEGNSNVQHV
ncbi:hypothetical protein SDC9_193257 [bioreactor metagenome]|uniref:RNA polymerase sigma-70 region 4 domain-containing protein n=1 Tax=bioreactor metagenome TaxID=1076179 RepID=A0A645I364_9ZZZZ